MVAIAGQRIGIATGASARNWASYGQDLALTAAAEQWQRTLLTDPQTSGGLLIACAESALEAVQAAISAAQGEQGAVIGRMVAGAPQLQVE